METRYTWTTTKLAITRAGLEPDGVPREEVSVIPPDPPELCEAYDAWFEEYSSLRSGRRSLGQLLRPGLRYAS